MARDRDLVSDKEMYRKILDIVEYISDSEIKLTMFEGDNYIQKKEKDKNKYVLNLATPNIKHIDKMTALGHECGHILGKSPIQSTSRMIKFWIKDDIQSTELYNLKYNMYWSVYNIIEDQRIEYYILKNWRAYIKRFNDTRKNLGADMPYAKNPADELLAIRFYRDDLVLNKNKQTYIDVMNKVEGTGMYGAVKLLIMLRPIIEEYFKSLILENNDTNNKNHNIEKVKDSNGKYSYINNDFDKKPFNRTVIEKDINENSNILPDEIINGINIDNIDDVLEGDKEEFDNDMYEIQEKMASNEQPKINRNYKIIKREGNYNMNYNKNISESMNKLFRKIHEMKTDTISYNGEEVDVESYIENIVKGSDINNSMLDKKLNAGLSILISIDGSGSMRNSNRIITAQELVMTLYKSVQGLKGINIEANVWSSNNTGIVGITEIHNINEVKNIQLTSNYGLTPTHLAIEYSSDQLYKMKGRKKLLIMITDGVPEYKINQFQLPMKNMIKMCKKSLLYALRKTPNIMCILIRNSYGSYDGITSPNAIMRSIFGKSRYINCNDMNNASERVIKEFKHLVIRTLK